MNKTYRIKYNQHTGAYVAVAEISTARGKSGGSGRLVAAALLAAGLVLSSTQAMAIPSKNADGTVNANNGFAMGTGCVVNPAVAVGQSHVVQRADGSTYSVPVSNTSQSAWVEGEYGLALGSGCDAPALAMSNAVAIGNGAAASENAISLGRMALAKGVNSVAIGANALALGGYAVAQGHAANAGGDFSIAQGQGANAGGDFSIAQGRGANAGGDTSIAQGQGANAGGDFSIAQGQGANAGGVFSIAQGLGANATGKGSIAIGIGALAHGSFNVAMGMYSGDKSQGSGNVAVGFNAGDALNGNDNTLLGNNSGNFITGNDNVTLGRMAGSVSGYNDDVGTYIDRSGGKTKISVNVSNSVSLGALSLTLQDNGVALGSGAIANTAAGQVGYLAGGKTDAVWQATLAAVSVGGDDPYDGKNVVHTRQITNVAAGTTLTDAVNVAQLQAAVANIPVVSFVSVKGNPTDGNYKNDGASGLNAIAIGANAVAKGNFALAEGYGANAAGLSSLAMGDNAQAAGANGVALGRNSYASLAGDAVAIGANANAKNLHSIAIGGKSIANESGSMAIGFNSNAHYGSDLAVGLSAQAFGSQGAVVGYLAKSGGRGGVAVGARANAINQGAVAVGMDSRANMASVAVGQEAHANAMYAVSIGHTAVASEMDSVALGNSSEANRSNTVSVGKTGWTRQITNVKAGTDATDAVNVAQLQAAVDNIPNLHFLSVQGANADSNYSNDGARGSKAIAIGANAVASGHYSVAEGYGANAAGFGALAVGKGALAAQNYALATGYEAQAFGNNSIADGYQAQAKADYSIAEGHQAQAIGALSHASGYQAQAWGKGAIADGFQANAFGAEAIAIGSLSNALGNQSVALGLSATAEADMGVALGNGAKVNQVAQNGMALGAGSVANAVGSVALGASSVANRDKSVSVGAVGFERQITNVAAGTTLTDAVNVAQLQAATAGLIPLAQTAVVYDSAAKAKVTLGGAGSTVPVTLTNLQAAALDANSKDAVTGAQLYATNTVQTAQGNAIATNASSINQLQQGWNLSSNGGAATAIQAGDGVNFVNGQNIAISQTGNSISIATAANAVFNQLTVGGIVISGNGIDAGGKVISNVGMGAVNATSSDAVTGAQLYQAMQTGGSNSGAIAQLQQGFALQVDGVQAQQVKAGDSVNLQSGKNVSVSQTGTGTEVALADDIQVNSVQVGTVAITQSGINAGGKVISNVADGKLNSDAANMGQLRDLQASFNVQAEKQKFLQVNAQAGAAAADATGDNATAVGVGSQASGNNAIAVGTGSNVSGNNSLSVGTGNVVSGDRSGAIGDPNLISGSDSYALGNDNTIAANKSFVVGNNVTIAASVSDMSKANGATFQGSVALGDSSTVVAAVGTTSTKLRGETYSFAGSKPVGTVSVGSKDAERTITNVAAGRLDASSTDAVNGSQLYATNQALNKLQTGSAGMLQNAGAADANGVNNHAKLVSGDDAVPVRLSNVARGTEATDAVNVQQLNEATNRLERRVNDMEDDANSGIAAAMAVATLGQAYERGQKSVSMGGSVWRGETGYAVGVSTVSEEGSWLFKANGAVSSKGYGGGGVSATYLWH